MSCFPTRIIKTLILDSVQKTGTQEDGLVVFPTRQYLGLPGKIVVPSISALIILRKSGVPNFL